MDTELHLDLSQARMTLEQLAANARDLTPAHKAIALKMEASVQRNFEVGGRYSRAGEIMGGPNKWQPTKAPPVYKRGSKAKGIKKGDEKGSTLCRSGHLKRSMVGHGNREEAVVQTNLEYAAIHNFGGKAGRGRNVTIPARPFLVIQEEDIDTAKDIFTTHLLRSSHQ